MTKLKKIESREDLSKLIIDVDALALDLSEESVYQIENGDLEIKNDELLDIEIALRKCDRVGVFD